VKPTKASTTKQSAFGKESARSCETSEEEAVDSCAISHLLNAGAVNPSANPIRPGTRMNEAILGEHPFFLHIARMQIGFGETER
jgi:hypothetical protein